jgi:hypothetical protein
MSERSKQSAKPPVGFPLPDPAQWREAYDQFWQQSGVQWDQFLRHPLFLSAMAGFLEQSQQQAARVQQVTGGMMQMMNLPTHEDFQELIQSVEALRASVAELCQRLDRLPQKTGTSKQAAGKRPAVKRVRKRT